MIIALFIGLSLWSAVPLDTSWHCVGPTPPRNWLGFSGSTLADLITLSLGSLAPTLPLILGVVALDPWRKKLWHPAWRLALYGLALGCWRVTSYPSLACSISLIFFIAAFRGHSNLPNIKFLLTWIRRDQEKFPNNPMPSSGNTLKPVIPDLPLSSTTLAPSRSSTPPTSPISMAPLSPSTPSLGTLPPLELLRPYPTVSQRRSATEERSPELISILEDFGVKGSIIAVHPGPVITLYEFEPAAGVKASRVISLTEDIARSMSALSARIAIISGRNTLGIELPHDAREHVYLRDLLSSQAYQQHGFSLPLVLGKDISGQPFIADLARMPHLLIAGTTGSGKSVGVNAMILSLMYALPADQCRFIMIDPKMLELSVYEGIPHLLTSVVTDPRKAVQALNWAVQEMERRYQMMAQVGVRNIQTYNQRVASSPQLIKTIQVGFDTESGKPLFESQTIELVAFPFIVVIVDEIADLMLVAGRDIEIAVQRLAQMARAAGIHLIMATQRPSVDVITGTIKANFPTRISFQVTSKIDSRTILGEQGAENLLGQGDMLYMASAGRLVRLHGPFVSDKEVESVVAFLKQHGPPPEYNDVIVNSEDSKESINDSSTAPDPLYSKAVTFIQSNKRVSTSSIQREFQIGYNRAARLVDRMEKDGIISPPNSMGKRELLLRDN